VLCKHLKLVSVVSSYVHAWIFKSSVEDLLQCRFIVL